MDCPTCEAMVDAYVDGELHGERKRRFRARPRSLPGLPARGWRPRGR